MHVHAQGHENPQHIFSGHSITCRSLLLLCGFRLGGKYLYPLSRAILLVLVCNVLQCQKVGLTCQILSDLQRELWNPEPVPRKPEQRGWSWLVVSLRRVSWHTQAGPDPVRGLGLVAMVFG